METTILGEAGPDREIEEKEHVTPMKGDHMLHNPKYGSEILLGTRSSSRMHPLT